MRAEPGWRRHLFYRKESIRTTWKLRFALVAFIVAAGYATFRFWGPLLAGSLVCSEEVGPTDAILIENFDENYLLFKRAAELQRAGSAARVLVPVPPDQDGKPTLLSTETAALMCRMAGVQKPELVAVRETEPITLNAALQLRDFLQRERLRSVLLLTSGFRSRRSALVYHRAWAPAGIRVSCLPVFGQTTTANWANRWHGVEEVIEQLVKLLYYRLYVLPARAA